MDGKARRYGSPRTARMRPALSPVAGVGWGEASPGAEVSWGEPSPGADVSGVGPVSGSHVPAVGTTPDFLACSKTR